MAKAKQGNKKTSAKKETAGIKKNIAKRGRPKKKEQIQPESDHGSSPQSGTPVDEERTTSSRQATPEQLSVPSPQTEASGDDKQRITRARKSLVQKSETTVTGEEEQSTTEQRQQPAKTLVTQPKTGSTAKRGKRGKERTSLEKLADSAHRNKLLPGAKQLKADGSWVKSRRRKRVVRLGGLQDDGSIINVAQDDAAHNTTLKLKLRTAEHFPQVCNSRTRSLENHGSRCHRNAMLQSLLHIADFHNFLELKHDRCSRDKECVLCMLKQLARRYWNEEVDQNGNRGFEHAFENFCNAFDHWCVTQPEIEDDVLEHEQDPSESQGWLLDALSAAGPPIRTLINELFELQFEHRLRCSCGAQIGRSTSTSWKYWPLPIATQRTKPRLEECIANYLADQVVPRPSEQQACRARDCKDKSTAIESSKIVRAPRILTISLQRLVVGKAGTAKLSDVVRYPSFLKIPTGLLKEPFQMEREFAARKPKDQKGKEAKLEETREPKETQKTSKKDENIELSDPSYKYEVQYKLAAVVSHVGKSFKQGHYFAVVGEPRDGHVVSCSDRNIVRVVPRRRAAAMHNAHERIRGSEFAEQGDAYLLYYVRHDQEYGVPSKD